MAISKAHIIANKKNARRSTGHRTTAGRARTRDDAFQHGRTDQGLCLPIEGEREVQFDSSAKELCPRSGQELFCTRRAAMLTLRIDRCYVKEDRHLRKAIRDALTTHDKHLLDEPNWVENLDATLDLVGESVTLGSFGSRLEPEPVEPVIEAASNSPNWPVASDLGPSQAPVSSIEGHLRE